MRYSNMIVKSISVLAVLTLLPSCKSIFTKPYPMPSGYTYHQGEYKSPPPATAPDIGYEYSEKKNEEVLNMWRPKVEELVDRLEQESGLRNTSFYIRVPLNTDPQMATFDHVLRDTLRDHGHNIVSDHYAGIIMTYNIIDPEALDEDDDVDIYARNEATDSDKTRYFGNPEYKAMILELTAIDKTVPIASVSGVYTVPMYGYNPYTHPFFKAIAGNKPVGDYDATERKNNE